MINQWLLFFLIAGCFYTSSGESAGGLELEEVAPGIFVHFGRNELPNKINHGAIANIGFIVGRQCVAVIDSGGNPRQGYALLQTIKQQTPLPVCYVINSHVHPDHIFGNIAFNTPGVKFVGHQKLPRAMAMRGAYYIDKAAEQLPVKLTEKHIVAPDLLVKQQLTLDLGGRELTLTAHRTAHTDNDLSVYDEQTNTMWLSDLLFVKHIPVLDGSLLGWLKVLNSLEQRRFNRVIPGHGPLITNWPNGMQPQKAYLQMLLGEVRAAIKQGIFLEQTLDIVGRGAQRQWLLYDQFHRKNVTTAFAELEWEEQ